VPVDFVEVARETVAELHVEAETDISAGGRLVLADPGHVHRILLSVSRR
jgi:hypothetical protein